VKNRFQNLPFKCNLQRYSVEYDPVFHPEAAAHRSFRAAPHLASLVYPTAVGFRHG
jgi:hypothetical protein